MKLLCLSLSQQTHIDLCVRSEDKDLYLTVLSKVLCIKIAAVMCVQKKDPVIIKEKW